MNQKTAKLIRRMAEQEMVKWYKSLLPEEDTTEQITVKFVKENIPYVDYYIEDVEATYKGTVYHQRILHISQHTQRWFYKMEKTKYVRQISCDTITRL